jgi:hypothetical protein
MNNNLLNVRQVIIWGYPKDTHTHSYIHEAYYRAFQRLGYTTYWFDNGSNIENFNFSETLFLTSGDVESVGVPLRGDCLYITHNCPWEKFKEVRDKLVNTQVLTKDVPNIANIVRENTYTFIEDLTVYQPWATNLLPDEIDVTQTIKPGSKEVNYVGTVADTGYSNVGNCLRRFSEGCAEDGIKVTVFGGYTPGNFIGSNINSVPGFLDDAEHLRLIKRSAFAPQFCGDFQLDIGYIPCRIFKNISYGHHGLTNSPYVNDLFDGQLIYDSDGYNMYTKVRSFVDSSATERLMKLVRDKHTFINRVETILKFFK